MASSNLSPLAHGSSSSSVRIETASARAPQPSFPSPYMGPGGAVAYAASYSVPPGFAPGGAIPQPLPAMADPYPIMDVSQNSADGWAQPDSAEPVKERPILSQHGYYMCIAVSIVVAIGLVMAFCFFVMQRRLAQIMLHKK